VKVEIYAPIAPGGNLNEPKPRPGQRGLLLAFGAGFAAFAALIELA
jgi:hypothetical protein